MENKKCHAITDSQKEQLQELIIRTRKGSAIVFSSVCITAFSLFPSQRIEAEDQTGEVQTQVSKPEEAKPVFLEKRIEIKKAKPAEAPRVFIPQDKLIRNKPGLLKPVLPQKKPLILLKPTKPLILDRPSIIKFPEQKPTQAAAKPLPVSNISEAISALQKAALTDADKAALYAYLKTNHSALMKDVLATKLFTSLNANTALGAPVKEELKTLFIRDLAVNATVNVCTACKSGCTAHCTSGCTSGCTFGCTRSCTSGCTAWCTNRCQGQCTGCTGYCNAGCTAMCTSSKR